MKEGKLSGSRNDDGNVPNVNWNDGKLKVNWYNPDNANDNLRTREVVSTRIIPELLGDYWLFVLMEIYFIQPFSILEMVCSSPSNRRYCLSVNMLIS